MAFLFFVSWIRVQPKPLNRFWRLIRQKNRFGPRRCLWGVKKFPKNFFTPKMVKNPLSHAFQWETEMLITFERYGRSSPNLVCSILTAAATRGMLKNRKLWKQDGRRRHLGFSYKVDNSESIHPIGIKFYSEHRLGSKMKFSKIQDGRRRPTEIYKYCYNFKTVNPKWTKFGRNHLLRTRNKKLLSKFWIFKSKMAAGRHFVKH